MPADKKDANKGVEIPSDLAALTDEELASFLSTAEGEFDTLTEGDIDADGLARATQLAESIEAARTNQSERAAAVEAQKAEIEGLRARVHADPDAEAEPDEGGEGAPVEEGAEGVPAEPALVAGGRRKVPAGDVVRDDRNKLNVRLSEAAKRVPAGNAPSVDQQFDASVLVASSDIPGFTQGAEIADMRKLVDAYKHRARVQTAAGRALAHGRPIRGDYLDITGRQPEMKFGVLGHEGDWRECARIPIAQLQRSFRHMLSDQSSAEQTWEVMQAAANPQALVAAGGWCSPSEIRYDFYNIVGMDGALDLPTTGIQRGGVRFPTSPSFGDLASSTGLWHWTETQDIAAATGTAQSGSKTCARVPCASFNEVRLEGEGICITAGNLTTDAWPEQIANFLRLVNAAHFHRVNSFFVNALIAQSTAVTLTQTNSSPVTDILAGVEHQAWDLRTKYAMNDSDVLEVIMPSWVMGLLRADISRRSGMASAENSFAVTNAMIAAWFTVRNIRLQLVQDFDVRGTNQFGQSSALNGAWPATVRFLIYPAGTWLRGNGLNLDLGIIRDSTLNATNDYTAAWSEEFFLLAKIGHESRIVTLGASGSVPTGTTAVGLTATGI